MRECPQGEKMQLVRLFVGCFRQFLSTVADIRQEQTRKAVDEPLSILVGDMTAITTHDDWQLVDFAERRETRPEMFVCKAR